MDTIPPAPINKQVTEDRMRWLTSQPFTITIDKDKIDQEFLDKLSTPTAVLNNVVIKPNEFIIDDRTKDFILFELQQILRHSGFDSDLLDNGSLRVSKRYWKMDVGNIRELLPFPECLPHQIEQAYRRQYENNLYSSQSGYPNHLYLELANQTIIDNTDGDL